MIRLLQVLGARQVLRAALSTALILICAAASFAEVWLNNGQTWTHKNGLSVTFPAAYKVNAERNGTLTVSGQGGFVNIVFTPVSGKEAMKEAMDGLLMVMRQARVQLNTESTTATQNGVNIAYQDGSCKSNGVPVYVKLGIFNRKESYLLMQLLVPNQVLPENKKDIDSITNSVK
jgi:hypothetical protein